ncbi:CRP/FNR family nitrogen fixation transcriptional regulator [Sinorhizobium meliloti]|uniref:Cyclic nucleotide-binding domain-containing protein n=1 Tax=Sinorhizobium meliloti (strain SM11) TaxID=707241 RepID=F7XCA4_SINMM|nr:Hypothetical protein SM11_pC0322 [Sinorhizobium meliloti SM11]MBP2470885.1 CRP/FNR family nitrogen fixation transcriptional regulator [Sinorhizobium meliloti]
MYAAAQAKPQSIEAEHLGPAAIPRPHLVATYKPGCEIYAHGDLNYKCYQVSTGAVRVYRLLSDGRRQVVSFHLPGECSVSKRDPTILFSPKPSRKQHWPSSGAQERSRELLALTLTGMARAQQHLLLIGRQCAVERNEQVVRSTIWSISRSNDLKEGYKLYFGHSCGPARRLHDRPLACICRAFMCPNNRTSLSNKGSKMAAQRQIAFYVRRYRQVYGLPKYTRRACRAGGG